MAVVVLVVCGAPLTQRVGDVARALVEAGWETEVIGTPSAMAWINAEVRAELGIRFEFRAPLGRKRLSVVDAIAVCPATFNTTNKIVTGVADNYAVSVACEAIGQRIPTVVAPMVNDKLWGHFGWENSLETLVNAGVRFVDVQTGDRVARPVRSGTGDIVVQRFDPLWLVRALPETQ